MKTSKTLAGVALALTMCVTGTALAHDWYFDRHDHYRHFDGDYFDGHRFFHGGTVYFRDASGGVFKRNGDSVYRRTSSGDVYKRNGDNVYFRSSSGDVYKRSGDRVYERDSSGATHIYYAR